MSDSVKKVVVCVLLIVTLNFNYCEAGYSHKLIRDYSHSIQQEMNKQKNFYKNEHKRQEQNPDYKIRDYKEVEKQKAIEKRQKQEKYIKDVGYWRWVGSEIFGKWVLYLPKIRKTMEYIEQRVNAEANEYRKLNPLYNGFVPYKPIIPFGA